jgi:cell division protein FtsI (penicillin-binding protein 3)
MGNNQYSKIVILFSSIVLLFVFLTFYLISQVFGDRNTPKLTTQKVDKAIRADIISKDGFHLANSKKSYLIAVNTKYIDPDKKELFIKLLSIYSQIDENILLEKINSRSGYTVLSKKIDSKTAKNLKELSYKLFKLKVFKPKVDKKNNKVVYYGLSIQEVNEKRNYQYTTSMTPIIGYTKKYEMVGVKGLEKYYDDQLKAVQDGIIYGQKDINGYIIFNDKSKIIRKVNGSNIHLNIPLKFQFTVDNILTKYQDKLQAKEIVASVMDSKTGKILALSSSNRYNPMKILQDDIPKLNATVVEHSYEIGSVTKPILLAGVLERGLAKKLEIVKGYNGRFRVGRKVITDTHPEDWISVEDIIVHSSNIGIAQLAMKMTGAQIYDTYNKFGFTHLTNIDLPYEKSGLLPRISKLDHDVYKATTSYGYGMRATFMQVLKAYNAFNNYGVLIDPKIVEYISDDSGNRVYIPKPSTYQATSKEVAKTVHKILIKTVNRGTGKETRTKGLEIGGKTGTAHIAKSGKYVNEYITSFFGFANDKENRYTIGVTVFEPQTEYFASKTAVPIFKAIVDEMIQLQYLVPTKEK